MEKKVVNKITSRAETGTYTDRTNQSEPTRHNQQHRTNQTELTMGTNQTEPIGGNQPDNTILTETEPARLHNNKETAKRAKKREEESNNFKPHIETTPVYRVD